MKFYPAVLFFVLLPNFETSETPVYPVIFYRIISKQFLNLIIAYSLSGA